MPKHSRARLKKPMAPALQRYSASIAYDRRLAAYDVAGSIAHARMLGKQGIIPVGEAKEIVAGLKRIERELAQGSFPFREEFEDIHMNVEARLPEVGERLMAEREDVRADLARVVALWDALLGAHGGPLLFGRFTIADAFFAPVCNRIRTYALPVPAEISAYVEEVLALPSVQAWNEGGLAEKEFLDFEEPYRTGR